MLQVCRVPFFAAFSTPLHFVRGRLVGLVLVGRQSRWRRQQWQRQWQQQWVMAQEDLTVLPPRPMVQAAVIPSKAASRFQYFKKVEVVVWLLTLLLMT